MPNERFAFFDGLEMTGETPVSVSCVYNQLYKYVEENYTRFNQGHRAAIFSIAYTKYCFEKKRGGAILCEKMKLQPGSPDHITQAKLLKSRLEPSEYVAVAEEAVKDIYEEYAKNANEVLAKANQVIAKDAAELAVRAIERWTFRKFVFDVVQHVAAVLTIIMIGVAVAFASPLLIWLAKKALALSHVNEGIEFVRQFLQLNEK